MAYHFIGPDGPTDTVKRNFWAVALYTWSNGVLKLACTCFDPLSHIEFVHLPPKNWAGLMFTAAALYL